MTGISVPKVYFQYLLKVLIITCIFENEALEKWLAGLASARMFRLNEAKKHG